MASGHPELHPHRAEILVIGYGNELRGDDALGPRVAAAVESAGLPRVRVLSVHQLTPDLALAISEAQRVIFVDACSSPAQQKVECRPVYPSREMHALGHTSHPGELLAMAQALYHRAPSAWIVTAPGASFALGEVLSAGAQAGFEAATRAVCGLCLGA